MIVHQPAAHPGDRCADPTRPARLVGPSGERDQRFRHPVALDRNLAGQGGDVTGHAGRQRGAAGDEQPGARRAFARLLATRQRATTPSAHRRTCSRRSVRLPPHTAPGCGRSVWISVLPTWSGPSTPRTNPCTWNNGKPCTTTSSGRQAHASATPSRHACTARRDSSTPLGAPVVPDVYMINAVLSAGGPGSVACERAYRSTGTVSISTPSTAPPSQIAAPQSRIT